jgi:hypothetical protein
MTTEVTETAETSTALRADRDMPEEIDFSDAVRGPAGRRLMVEWARFRRALRTIAEATDRTADPRRAAEEMRSQARRALGTQSTQGNEEVA